MFGPRIDQSIEVKLRSNPTSLELIMISTWFWGLVHYITRTRLSCLAFKMQNDHTPLMWVCNYANTFVSSCLDGWTDTWVSRLAVFANDRTMIDFLRASGEDINAQWKSPCVAIRLRHSCEGTAILRYPIEFSAQTEGVSMVKFLLSRGARLENTNALHAAASDFSRCFISTRLEVIAFLLKQGMDINKLEFAGEEEIPAAYDRCYGTPLRKFLNSCRLLARCTWVFYLRRLPFTWLRDYYKYFTNASLLLYNHGTPSETGLTQTDYAAAWGLPEIVEFLLQNGADPTIQGVCYKDGSACGTPVEWQPESAEEDGVYNPRVLVLLGGKQTKL